MSGSCSTLKRHFLCGNRHPLHEELNREGHRRRFKIGGSRECSRQVEGLWRRRAGISDDRPHRTRGILLLLLNEGLIYQTTCQCYNICQRRGRVGASGAAIPITIVPVIVVLLGIAVLLVIILATLVVAVSAAIPIALIAPPVRHAW